MLTREQILEIDTYCVEHQVIANNVTWMNTTFPGTNTMFGNGSTVKKTNSLLNRGHSFSCVLVESLSLL